MIIKSVVSLMFAVIATQAFSQVPDPAAQSTEPHEAKQIESRYTSGTNAFEKAFDEAQKSHTIDQPFAYDLTDLAKFLRAQRTSAKSAEARDLAALYLVQLSDYRIDPGKADCTYLVNAIAPESRMWARAQDAIRSGSRCLDAADGRRLLINISSKNPNREVQAHALVALAKLEMREQNQLGRDFAYYTLVGKYNDLKPVKFEISQLNPSNKVSVGKKAPSFMLPLIDSPGQISSNDLAGKWYLVDVWATWCGPCLGERAALTKVYSIYHKRNFEIVSVSVDEKPEAVTEFRKTRWSMPWEHVFLRNWQENPISKEFDIDWMGLPRTYLVSPQGVVAAVGDDLNPEMIDKTLRSLLEPGSN